jgi:hypothetical protein
MNTVLSNASKNAITDKDILYPHTKWVIPEKIHTPLRRKYEVNPPTSFGCPNTFTIIRNNFFSPPPPDGRNFLHGGSMDLFWNDPISVHNLQMLYFNNNNNNNIHEKFLD